MRYIKIISTLLAIIAFYACQPEPELAFCVDVAAEDGKITIGPEGGVRTMDVTSSEDWVVETSSPWITVSPANGRGNFTCKIMIDSTLVTSERSGQVRVRSLGDEGSRDVDVIQGGFGYQIVMNDAKEEIDDFAEFGFRSFDVTVASNVDFDVIMTEEAKSWLSFTKSELILDRGVRPRNVSLHFEWKVNTRDEERVAKIEFKPLEAVELVRKDTLTVIQKGAMPIPVGTPAGDSLSLLAISRALGTYLEWPTSERMEHWDNVSVWKEGPNKGRVRFARFFIFNTKEVLPFEVQNLTAAEELSFYSNANQFMKSLDTGDAITKLIQLKRLTIGAYGLVTLHPDFVNLKNLEYLDLSSNCFQSIPDILTPENFPNLHALVLNANQRSTIYDLSNNTKTEIGGFLDDDLGTSEGMEVFKRLLRWEKLDTIRLSVNYLQGHLPDMRDENLPVWTFEELKDSLATGVTELPEELQDLPKVLPNTKYFAINYNRFTGKIPDWLLYHPKLDLWAPYVLVFPQEGKTVEGESAGFTNEPTSFDNYYEIYANKKYNPNKTNR